MGTIKFIKRHSPGPFKYCIEQLDMLDGCEPLEGHTVRHAPYDRYSNIKFSNKKEDYLLCAQSTEMDNFLIEQAKSLYNMLLWAPSYEGKPVPWQKLEFDKIIGILKKAGIEVIEE